MKLTKYGHACFTLEKDGQTLVIDPGQFTRDFTPSDTIAGIIVTHEHGDHFDPDVLANIYGKNPNSLLISTQEVIDKMPDHLSQLAQPGQKLTVGPFMLEFFGAKHAIIHDTLPIVDNFGVLINDDVYFPGDSFTLLNRPVDVLALPVSAPWLKISEAMDFFITVKPLLAFPTHDAILSDIGKNLVDDRMTGVAKDLGTEYRRIDGQTIEV
jgi:L-ascorbate metabolism protein UlaG (beta-lactamase superfamily)